MTAESPPAHSLIGSARSALVWAAGSAVLRDVVQFAAMILLVRLLMPADYGRFAIAQAIVTLISVFSAKAFVMHSLQMRDPGGIPWQSHFTASVAANLVAFLVTLIAAAVLTFLEEFASAAVPLAVMSTSLLLDIGVQFSTARLKASQQWARYSRLVLAGTFLGLASAVLIALAGGGVWALVATVLLPAIPLNVDLFARDKWRPDWSLNRREYRPVVLFGFTRIGGAVLLNGRTTVEQAVLGAHHDLATLGIFNRTIGLSTLLAGRIGVEVVGALFPVITRADEGSERFQRIAGLLLQSIAWTSLPAAAFLIMAGGDVVDLLYGPRWSAVKPWLPAAAACAATAGISGAAYSLMLANNRPRACLLLDILSAAAGTVLIFWLIPSRPDQYLVGLTLLSAAMLLITSLLLHRSGGMRISSLADALGPPMLAVLMAAAALSAIGSLGGDQLATILRIPVEASIFAAVYALSLRMFFPNKLRQLVELVPFNDRLRRFLWL